MVWVPIKSNVPESPNLEDEGFVQQGALGVFASCVKLGSSRPVGGVETMHGHPKRRAEEDLET